jgi:hypothetical protein
LPVKSVTIFYNVILSYFPESWKMGWKIKEGFREVMQLTRVFSISYLGKLSFLISSEKKIDSIFWKISESFYNIITFLERSVHKYVSHCQKYCMATRSVTFKGRVLSWEVLNGICPQFDNVHSFQQINSVHKNKATYWRCNRSACDCSYCGTYCCHTSSAYQDGNNNM